MTILDYFVSVSRAAYQAAKSFHTLVAYLLYLWFSSSLTSAMHSVSPNDVGTKHLPIALSGPSKRKYLVGPVSDISPV